MKTILSFQRVAFLALALGTASATAIFADSTSTTSTTTTAPTCSAGGHHHLGSVLTADEITQLKTAHDTAIANNSSLKTQEDNVKAQFETLKGEGKGVATKDQWQALHEQARTFHQNLKAAELAVDPTLAPIFAKLEAAHQNWHHSAGGSATP
jgi:hypothetical protein